MVTKSWRLGAFLLAVSLAAHGCTTAVDGQPQTGGPSSEPAVVDRLVANIGASLSDGADLTNRDGTIVSVTHVSQNATIDIVGGRFSATLNREVFTAEGDTNTSRRFFLDEVRAEVISYTGVSVDGRQAYTVKFSCVGGSQCIGYCAGPHCMDGGPTSYRSEYTLIPMKSRAHATPIVADLRLLGS